MNTPSTSHAALASAPTPAQAPEQLRYARWLEWSTRAGLAVLVLSFAAYVSGLVPPRVPPAQLPELWRYPAKRFVDMAHIPIGWGWTTQLAYGDVTALLGIALLAGCSVLCLAALVPMYRARGDKVFAVLCAAEVMVIGVAASGWLGGVS